MAVISGKSGSIKFGSNAIAELTQWELSLSPEYEARQVFGNDHKTRDLTGYDYSFAVQGFYDATDTAQAAIVDDSLNGTSAAISALTGNGSTTAESWDSTSVVVSDLKITQGTGGLVGFSCTLSGDAALTHTDPA